MSAEDVPALNGLLVADFGERHGAGEADHGEHGHTDGELVTDDLCTATHGTNQGVFVVATPSGQQDADNAKAADGEEEEDADIEVDDLRSLVPRQASKGDHGSRHDKERGEVVQEEVGLTHVDDFLRQHLKHVAEHLQ